MTTSLIATLPNLQDPDGFYAALVAAHQDLSDEASELLNARLVLILANHIGELAVLQEALVLARASLAAGQEDDPAAAHCHNVQGGRP